LEAGYRCAVDARVLLHDVKTQSVWLVAENTKSGEDFDTPGEVQCPKVSFRTWWHPDGTQWLVEQTSGDAVQWLPGSVANADDYATAPFQPADFAARVEVKDLPDGGLKTAWKMAFAGDFQQALLALSRDETGSADKVLLMAMLFSLNGETDAAKKIAKEAVKVAKTPWTEGLLGVIQMAAGDTKKAQQSLARTTKTAKNYEDLAKLGAALTLVDLELSNRLFIHALSHKSAAEGDTTVIYAALIQGLIEVGENQAAADLLAKVSQETGIFKLLQARLALMTQNAREAKAIVDDVLFTEPGRCMVYGLAARLAVLDGDTAEALEQYRAAALCSPNDLEARYFVADLEAQRGDLVAAKRAVDAFLKAAAPRKNDPVRDARRKVMESARARYTLSGVVLLNVSCRSTVCQGQVFNSTDSEISAVKIAAFSGDAKVVGNIEVETIPSKTARPFMVRTEGPATTITAGRDEAELKANMTEQSESP
jgi:Tfp pilus assembly protein PilF